MAPSKPEPHHSLTVWVTLCALLAIGLSALVATEAPARASVDSKNLRITRGTYDADNAPPSKYIKRVTETRTTENLNLRSQATTGAPPPME